MIVTDNTIQTFYLSFLYASAFESLEKYAKKRVKLRHKLSRNKTAKVHIGEYLLHERLHLVLVGKMLGRLEKSTLDFA